LAALIREIALQKATELVGRNGLAGDLHVIALAEHADLDWRARFTSCRTFTHFAALAVAPASSLRPGATLIARTGARHFAVARSSARHFAIAGAGPRFPAVAYSLALFRALSIAHGFPFARFLAIAFGFGGAILAGLLLRTRSAEGQTDEQAEHSGGKRVEHR
jgi:hypothetical protein